MWLAEKLFGTRGKPTPASAVSVVIDVEPERDGVEPGGTGLGTGPGTGNETPAVTAEPRADSGAAGTALTVQAETAAEPMATVAGREPPRLKLAPVPLEHHPPEAHARALLAWLQTGDRRGREGEILFDEMIAIYREMTMDLGWAERPWKPIAIEFTRLTTGRKVYAWVRTGAHLKQRLRVYPVPGVSDTRLEQLRAEQSGPARIGIRAAA